MEKMNLTVHDLIPGNPRDDLFAVVLMLNNQIAKREHQDRLL